MMFLCFVFVFFFYIYGDPLDLHVLTPSFPTLRSSDLREAVRIAFPPHLAVADDVDAQFLLIADRHQRRGFLRIGEPRSEEHTSELQSLMRISYAVFCLKKKKKHISTNTQLLTLLYSQITITI